MDIVHIKTDCGFKISNF